MMAPLLAALLAGPGQAGVLVTMDEALALAFPDCEIRERTHYLSQEQRQAAAERAGAPVQSALVREYQGVCEGSLRASAYFDSHDIRELPSTMMIVVGLDGSVERLELLSFEGDEQHRPPATFYTAIQGMSLGRDLAVRRSAIQPVSGATLSSRAAVEATRRVLALHEVIHGSP
jgi:hypothetical protein